jgi:predicted transcriptional regulator
LLAVIETLEQCRDRHLEGLRHAHEPAPAYAVDALLVLLHLLERHAEARGKLALRHAGGKAPDADVAPDHRVGEIGRLGGGCALVARQCYTFAADGLSRKLLRMFVERIVNEIFPQETGALRMQQIGLFTLIYVLHGDDEPVTASRIAAMTGQSSGQIHRQLQKLLKLELIDRAKIRNKQGRGHAYALTIRDTKQTRRLAKAIAKAAAARGERGAQTGALVGRQPDRPYHWPVAKRAMRALGVKQSYSHAIQQRRALIG